MMSRYLRHVLKLGLLVGDMAVSGAGGLVFLRSFRMVAMRQERPDVRPSMRADGRSTKPFAGNGAALILLALVASEAAAAMVAFRG